MKDKICQGIEKKRTKTIREVWYEERVREMRQCFFVMPTIERPGKMKFPLKSVESSELNGVVRPKNRRPKILHDRNGI